MNFQPVFTLFLFELFVPLTILTLEILAKAIKQLYIMYFE